ncbi:MAG: UPF0175 family protein [Candidatus Diapherotrites archaeon]
MSESTAIGIRLENDFLSKIDNLSKKESLDRSTTMRILLEKGYFEHIKKKAMEEYMKGKVSISKAAKIANTTIWEMRKYLIENGIKSEYSIKDLQKEVQKIK